MARVGALVGGTAVGVAVGGSEVGVLAGGTAVCVTVGMTVVGMEAGVHAIWGATTIATMTTSTKKLGKYRIGLLQLINNSFI